MHTTPQSVELTPEVQKQLSTVCQLLLLQGREAEAVNVILKEWLSRIIPETSDGDAECWTDPLVGGILFEDRPEAIASGVRALSVGRGIGSDYDGSRPYSKQDYVNVHWKGGWESVEALDIAWESVQPPQL